MTRKPQTFYRPSVKNLMEQPAPQGAPIPLPTQQITSRDLLPKTAALSPLYNLKKPNFAMAQDVELAYQYGVIRDGTHIRIERPAGTFGGQAPYTGPPVTPVEPKSLSMDQVAQPPPPPSRTTEPQPEEPEVKKETIVEKTTEEKEAEAAAEQRQQEKESYSEEPPILGATDLMELRERMSAVLLNSPEQRKIVESRLKGSFNYADFLLDNPIHQTVVIVPKGLEITFEALPYGTDLNLKRMIAEEADGPVFNEHLLDKFFLLGVAASVYAINGEVLPDYRDPGTKRFNPQRLEAKLSWLLRRPVAFVAMLSIQYVWFNDRMMRALEAIDPKAG